MATPQEILAAIQGVQPTELRSRKLVGAALRAPPPGRGPMGVLPDKFYDQDYIQLENEQPELENRPTWYPQDHPDFPSPTEKRMGPPTGYNEPTIAGSEGADTLVGGSPEFDKIMQAIQDTNKANNADDGVPVATDDAPPADAGGTAFQPGGTALANQATNWLVSNGKISSEDAARAAANLEVPGEIIARIGLGQAFLDQYPSFRPQIEAGDATGPIDWAGGKLFDQSTAAAINRRIASGQDAMRRMLTGAALTGTETNEYVSRYSPSMTDDAQSLLDKTDQLEREIKYIMGALMIGRGGTEILSDLKERLPDVGGRGADNPMPGQDPAVDTDGWKQIGNARVRIKR